MARIFQEALDMWWHCSHVRCAGAVRKMDEWQEAQRLSSKWCVIEARCVRGVIQRRNILMYSTSLNERAVFDSDDQSHSIKIVLCVWQCI